MWLTSVHHSKTLVKVFSTYREHGRHVHTERYVDFDEIDCSDHKLRHWLCHNYMDLYTQDIGKYFHLGYNSK